MEDSMPKSFYFVLILCLAAIGLSACTPTCDAGSLLPPDLVSPDWREVVDGGAAVLDWDYPDSCEPEEYEIILSQYRDYSVIEHTQFVPGDTTTWTASGLDPAEEYFWRVRARVGSTYGGYSLELRSFFTLPFCSASDLIAPYPQFPVSHDMYDNDYDSFEWYWPLNDCIPESYRIEVSRDEDFIDDEYNGATGSPGTRWGLGSAPPPATKMWWRVSAYSDGVWGPTGTEHFFYTAPACEGTDMVAPSLVSPADGAVIAAADQVLEWSWPPLSCVPDDYHVQVAEDPAFTILFDDHIGTAANWMAYGHLDPFVDCQTYYWRVAMVHDGVDGVFSPTWSFTVDLTDSCGISGTPGLSKGNYFCREGTFEWFDPLWTIEPDHRLLAVARNPQSTYVLLNILNQETNQPFFPEIKCWVYLGHITLGWPESPEGAVFDIEELPVVEPPEECQADLGPEDCKAAGGSYQLVGRTTAKYECVCP
jgi:hypothetical protein